MHVFFQQISVFPVFADSSAVRSTARIRITRPIPDYSFLEGTDYETCNDRDSDDDYSVRNYSCNWSKAMCKFKNSHARYDKHHKQS